MPTRYLVLTQKPHGFSRYNDVEGVIYHFPKRYLRLLNTPLTRFVYYRPAEGAAPNERCRYIGHGIIGEYFQDTNDPNLYYVPVLFPDVRFKRYVPLRDEEQRYYETGTFDPPRFEWEAVREVEEFAFNRIVIAGGVVSSRELSPVLTTESVLTGAWTAPIAAPKDEFRQIERIPAGTGYKPKNGIPVDVNESAALQERARKDHQDVLELLRASVATLGGTCWYNNNVDLLASVAERRFLIEAKSLVNPAAAVDRMRYGMGQLFDYRVRYEAEVKGATPVLAFGSRPTRDVSWIGTILQGNGVACVASDGGRIIAQNDLAAALPFLTHR